MTDMPDLPAALESAAVVFGNRTRLAIIGSLAHDGPATAAQLQRRLGLLPNAVQTHIRVLEAQDAVTAIPSRHSEPGPVIRQYNLDRERLATLSEALRKLTA